MLRDSDRRAVLQAAHSLPSRLHGHERVRAATGLVAWKRLDDCYHENVDRRRRQGLPEPANIHWHTLHVPPDASFRSATDAPQAFRALAHWNPCLQGHADLLAPPLSGSELDAARKPLLAPDFSEAGQDYPDVVGLAYEAVRDEYLRKNSRLGEFFTPCSVVRMMVAMTDPRPGQSVCDPACGSGRTLQEAARHVRHDWIGALPPPMLFAAQDIQPFLVAMTQASLLALGYANAVCIARDTLHDPLRPQECHEIIQTRNLAMRALRDSVARPARHMPI